MGVGWQDSTLTLPSPSKRGIGLEERFCCMDLVMVVLFGFLAGVGKAGRDTIAHHWERSVFFRIKSVFWFRWFSSDWRLRPSHPFWFLWDGWHGFDSLSILGLGLMGIWVSSWWDLVMGLVLFGIGFGWFYNKLLLEK
jgi:hypothetical protein